MAKKTVIPNLSLEQLQAIKAKIQANLGSGDKDAAPAGYITNRLIQLKKGGVVNFTSVEEKLFALIQKYQ